MIVNSKILNICVGGNFMIVMRIKLDHIYSFNNFKNFIGVSVNTARFNK